MSEQIISESAEVTYKITPVVRVEINGEFVAPYHSRKDNGLVARFNNWSWIERIFTTVSGGHSGGGSYCGYYTAQNAERIEEWLKTQGAKEETETL